MMACTNASGEQTMDDDDEYSPSPADIAQEEEEEPLMMANAQRWDNFLALVHSLSREWPQGAPDTDDYRKGRAVEAFNVGAVVANDLLELKPTMESWVPHILCFIVPRQMVDLGDPQRRACDACESYGAMLKKIIKHSTCRRRITGTGQTVQHGMKASEGATGRRWKQAFTVGFVQQAFTRACVRESLQHGVANSPFCQRSDRTRTTAGKVTSYHKFVEEGQAPPPSVAAAAKVEGARAVAAFAQA
jgi:hypothetical protein